jgi:replication factor A1
VALDGTDEAEMVCFGDVARRIIGKSVQQLLRTSPNANTYPPDVSKIVSLRFTFAVALTQQSYYRHQKTYQVISVVTPYGRQPAGAAPTKNSDVPSPDHTASQSTSEHIGGSDGTLSSSAPTNVIPCSFMFLLL